MKKEILLAHFPKITTTRYQHLLAAFSSLDEVWDAEFDELKKTKWDDNLIHEFLVWKENLNEEKIAKILEQEGIHCVTQTMEEYPTLLKEIYDPPLCLFVRGMLDNDNYNLAVVGTRKYSQYGEQVTREMVSELATQNITIISGLAFGIDAIAHDACLQAGGKTVAVLGSGINKRHIYPSANASLAEKIIAQGGAIISEYPPGTLPNKYTFPRRNRIVAGMSLGTLVVEAPSKSGALITAECSLDNGRDVFAIPQNITAKNAPGPNNLIKNGAKLVSTSSDIIEALNLQDLNVYVTNRQILPGSPTEATILAHISKEAIHVDELRKKSGMTSKDIISTLTLMEMKGMVRNLGNMMYVLAR